MKPCASSYLTAVVCAAMITGCAATGDEYASNVYTADMVNTQQEVKTVKIIAVLPAKVQVSNAAAKRNAQIIGGVLGALAGAAAGHGINHSGGTLAGGAAGGAIGVAGGSLVSDKVMVDGVSITYEQEKKTFNSAQVGKICQFLPGTAIMVTTMTSETRIQPNGVCPEKGAKKGE